MRSLLQNLLRSKSDTESSPPHTGPGARKGCYFALIQVQISFHVSHRQSVTVIYRPFRLLAEFMLFIGK